METRTIFFIGKPGCGKGTQATLLSETTGWVVRSAGDEFRRIAALDTPLGQKVKSQMDAGILEPSWFATYLYLQFLFALGPSESAIFDGFNRRAEEALITLDSLRWLDRSCTVLAITISDEEVMRRLALRKEVEGRADDSVVAQRLEEYYANTEPAIAKLREAGVLIEVNGEQTPEAIAADIRKVLTLS